MLFCSARSKLAGSQVLVAGERRGIRDLSKGDVASRRASRKDINEQQQSSSPLSPLHRQAPAVGRQIAQEVVADHVDRRTKAEVSSAQVQRHPSARRQHDVGWTARQASKGRGAGPRERRSHTSDAPQQALLSETSIDALGSKRSIQRA
eukprot:763996-Hanusia_phi.AAC.5